MTTLLLDDPRNSAPISGSADWRSAVSDLLTFWVSEGRCFSSGEVAACLRTHRTDLVFSVPRVGEHVRDLFYGQGMPVYVDDGTGTGNPTTPVQVSRFTVGLYPNRTPANTEVFVYGPNQQACLDHEFEVFIPKPGETQADAPAPAKVTAPPKTGPKSQVSIFGAAVASMDIRATVWPDGRVCVPRSAFEASVHLGGHTLRGGDPVYIHQAPGTVVTITLVDPSGGTDLNVKAYSLVANRGNVAFGSRDLHRPFKHGQVFKCQVSAGQIVLDPGNPL